MATQTKPRLRDKVGGMFAWARRGKGPVQVDVARMEDQPDGEDAPREVTLQQVKQGYGEIVETMRSVRDHLETQSDRSRRMLDLLEGLPGALQTLPESAKAQAQLLEAISTHLERQNETSGHLTEAISGLRDAANSQDRTLDSIRQHLSEESETRGQVQEGLTAVSTTLQSVEASNRATTDTMSHVAEQSRAADEMMREMFRRSQRTAGAMTAVSWALAIIALAVGVYVAIQVHQLSNATPVTPGAPAPAVTDGAGEALADGITDPEQVAKQDGDAVEPGVE